MLSLAFQEKCLTSSCGIFQARQISSTGTGKVFGRSKVRFRRSEFICTSLHNLCSCGSKVPFYLSALFPLPPPPHGNIYGALLVVPLMKFHCPRTVVRQRNSWFFRLIVACGVRVRACVFALVHVRLMKHRAFIAIHNFHRCISTDEKVFLWCSWKNLLVFAI